MSNCTYPFCTRRDFVRALTKDVIIEVHGRATPPTCFRLDKTTPWACAGDASYAHVEKRMMQG